jgi:septal ring factor EnvC (AmiA/AmiB activator)
MKNIWFVLVLIILIPATSFAQKDKGTLQKKYNNILKDIESIEDLIEETEDKKTKSLNQLQSLSAKIDSRETLIVNISEQILDLGETIEENKAVCKSMNKDIDALKEDYAKMVYHSYKNLNTTSTITFLLSSESFNQALRRLNYLKSYARNRQNSALQIKETIQSIESKVVKLEFKKAKKEELLLEEEHQKTILITEKIQKNNLITKLKVNSSSLQKQVSKKNNSALALNNQIQKIIQEEILLAEAKAKKRAETNSVAAEEFVKKETKLSKDFVNNKGKLPWPVNIGHIVEHFGKHPHPTLPKVTVSNNGINIRTETGESAKTIFSGVVVNSFYLPTTQNSLIIKHGEFFTVYSNLKTISVNLGDQLKTGDKIGAAYTDEYNVTKMHLEVWKSINKLNPEEWIKKTL